MPSAGPERCASVYGWASKGAGATIRSSPGSSIQTPTTIVFLSDGRLPVARLAGFKSMLGRSTFGKITTAQAERQVQFGLKLYF
jgi:hypothetical protein